MTQREKDLILEKLKQIKIRQEHLIDTVVALNLDHEDLIIEDHISTTMSKIDELTNQISDIAL